jgi:hypothetical protein
MKVKSGCCRGVHQLGEIAKYEGPLVVQKSVSIVIPVGSVDYLRVLSNCIRSVFWQEHVNLANIEVILVYLHREFEDIQLLDELANQYGLQLTDVFKPYQHFPLCLARNIGARAANNATLVFVDADAVLDPEFLARTLLRPGELVTCWFSYLQQSCEGSISKEQVRSLAAKGEVRKTAYGGGIAAPREIIEEIRGFDEVYDRAWGGDDNDMVDRLVEYGLHWHNLSLRENIVNLHQYHPRTVDTQSPEVKANRRYYRKKKAVFCNDDGWGQQ